MGADDVQAKQNVGVSPFTATDSSCSVSVDPSAAITSHNCLEWRESNATPDIVAERRGVDFSPWAHRTLGSATRFSG
jgi:hypothetical protein